MNKIGKYEPFNEVKTLFSNLSTLFEAIYLVNTERKFFLISTDSNPFFDGIFDSANEETIIKKYQQNSFGNVINFT